ncbi:MAG: response regulator [Candidatus Omnitrophica bacterium]|nr:response regulator [Candidatus Omnitrophota bacterium]
MKSPIVKRIIIFGVVSAFISLMLAALGFGIAEFYNIKKESRNKLSSQMDILIYNLQPVLLFDDAGAANKMLMSLRDDKSINRALLLDVNDKEFATFGTRSAPSDLRMVKPIVYDGKVIGRLVIESQYLGFKERLHAYLFVSLLIILISIPASYLISAPIRRQVSSAVNQLERQSDWLRLLADQLVGTEQAERKRIAALLHDHLQQILVACKLKISLAMQALNNRLYDKASADLETGKNFLEEAIGAAKSLTVELRPPVLYEDGLPAAFQWLAKKYYDQHNLKVLLSIGEIPPNLLDSLKIMLFESVRELLFNVVKHAKAASVELFMEYKNGVIIARVKDEGQGFDIGQLEKVSAKSFGLFSLRERLKLINGELNVESHPSQGTTVEIIVPVEMKKSPAISTSLVAKQESEKKAEKKRGSIKILLVDDHKLVREGLINILKEIPIFEIVGQAENGLEAVEKAESFHPDVVIMDVNMPELNGIEATRIMKTKFPSMEIVGLSVQDQQGVADSMKKAGAVTLLNKGGDPQELIKTIFSCVGK